MMLLILLLICASTSATIPSHRGSGLHLQTMKHLIPFEGTLPIFFHLPSAPSNHTMHRSYDKTDCSKLGLRGNGTCSGLSILAPFVHSAFEILETLTETLLRQDDPMFEYRNSTLSPELERLLKDFEHIQSQRRAAKEGTQGTPHLRRGRRQVHDEDKSSDLDPELVRLWAKMMLKEDKESAGEPGRVKGGFWSYMWENIFGVASIDTVQQSDDVIKYVDTVKKSLNLGHRELVGLETDLGSLSNDTANSVHKMGAILGLLSMKISQRMNESMTTGSQTQLYLSQLTMLSADLLSMIHTHTLLSAFLHIQNTCDNKRIPHAFIPPDVLRNALEKARIKLRDQSRTLAIPINDVELYYRIPLVQCTQGKNITLVKINVPYVQADSGWQIARIYPVPFSFNSATLYLDLPAQLIARNGEEIRIFESLDERKCGGQYEFLCMLPVHSSAHLGSRDCLLTLLGHPTAGEVQAKCPYTQLNHTAVHVSSLPGGVFSIAHLPKDATVHCLIGGRKTAEKIKEIPRWGNLEIELPCTCALMANGRTLAANRFPCSNETDLIDIPRVRIVVPNEWLTDSLHLTHPIKGGVSLSIPNLQTELMPFIKQLDASAPKRIDLTKLSELEMADAAMDRRSIIYQLHNWVTTRFPWSMFFTWFVIIVHSTLIALLFGEYFRKGGTMGMVAAAVVGGENIPMTAAQGYGPGPVVCVIPEAIEHTLYLILFVVIVFVVHRMWRFIWGCINFCYGCITLSRFRKWIFATRGRHDLGSHSNPTIRTLSPEREPFVMIDDAAPVYTPTVTHMGSNIYPNNTLNRMQEEIATSANSLQRNSSFMGASGGSTTNGNSAGRGRSEAPVALVAAVPSAPRPATRL